MSMGQDCLKLNGLVLARAMYIICNLKFPTKAFMFVEIPLKSPKVPSSAGDIPICSSSKLRVCH